jgi:hypothetical protein
MLKPNCTPAIKIPIPLSQGSLHHIRRELSWGWKRDLDGQSRAIFLAGMIKASQQELFLSDWSFFYRSLYNEVPMVPREGHFGPFTVRRKRCRTGQWQTQISTAILNEYHLAKLKLLLSRKPKNRIPTGDFPCPTAEIDISRYLPCVIYCGSGLSYEAGLLTLPELHQRFYVDDPNTGQICIGKKDPIPDLLLKNWKQTILSFLELDMHVLISNPSKAHLIIGQFYREGLFSRILTDNVDDLFEKVGVPYTRVRGDGITNQLYPIEFPRHCKCLLVVGVAADRRGIIGQARQAGLPIIIVNPVFRVSARSQNLSYMRKGDIFICNTADRFFERLKDDYLSVYILENTPLEPETLECWL